VVPNRSRDNRNQSGLLLTSEGYVGTSLNTSQRREAVNFTG
jgi:hypothetical protein